MKVTIIGDGGWGTAIALLLHGYGHQVKVWGAFPEYIKRVREQGENERFLPGIKLPHELRWCSDACEAVEGAEAVVLAVPSKHFASVCERFRGSIKPQSLVVSLAKGLCERSHRRMSELACEILQLECVAVLSGPSHAEEVARQLPTAVVAAAERLAVAEAAQQLFNGANFRVYTSADVVGVELGGAVKNVVAIACGAADGLGFGDNTRAALITRGLAEIARFGVALGAQAETFAGLSGVGDLIVTCTSRQSRNYQVGARLGRGESMEAILASMQMVAEGVGNSRIINQLSRHHGIEMPIVNLVYALCHEGFAARTAVEMLMAREVRPEI